MKKDSVWTGFAWVVRIGVLLVSHGDLMAHEERHHGIGKQ